MSGVLRIKSQASHWRLSLILACFLSLAFLTSAFATSSGRLFGATSDELTIQADHLRDTFVKIATDLKLRQSEISFSIRIPEVGLVRHAAQEPRIPASTMKLIVAAAVMDQLGPDFMMHTDLIQEGDVVGGELQGNLRIFGRGDPAVCGREKPDDVMWELRPWVDVIKKKGISAIRGKVLADARYLPGDGFHPDWPRDSSHKWYYAPSGALNLNDNCLDLSIGPVVSNQVQIVIEPIQPLARLLNRLKICTDQKKHLIRIDRQGFEWDIVVSGAFLESAGKRKFHVTVPDPETHFVGAFSELLAQSDLKVYGSEISVRLSGDSDKMLARISHSVQSRLPVLLKNSQNLYADAFLRIFAKEIYKDGSFQSSGRHLRAWVDDHFIDTDGLLFRDGSGLSRKNRVNARFLRILMDWILAQSWSDEFLDFMAISGVDGTLENRMTGDRMRGRVFAKTGTLNDVSSLVGMIKVPGEAAPISFALIYNGRKGQVSKARTWQDRCLQKLIDR